MLTRPPGVLAISRHVPVARFDVVSSCRPVAVPIGARTCHGKPSVAIGAAAFKHGSHDLVVRVLAHPLRLLAHPRFVTTTDPPRWHRTERGLFLYVGGLGRFRSSSRSRSRRSRHSSRHTRQNRQSSPATQNMPLSVSTGRATPRATPTGTVHQGITASASSATGRRSPPAQPTPSRHASTHAPDRPAPTGTA